MLLNNIIIIQVNLYTMTCNDFSITELNYNQYIPN